MTTTRLVQVAVAVALGGHAEAQSIPRVVGVAATATSTAGGHESWTVLVAGDARGWCEGKPGTGIGESLVLSLATPTRIEKVTIRAGAWESDDAFRDHDRVTRIDVIADNGKKVTASPPKERESVTVAIGGGPVTQLRFRIASVERSTIEDTCISGIDLVASSWTAFVAGVDRKAASALEPAIRAIAAGFESCDGKSLTKLVAFPLPHRRQPSEDGPTSTEYADVDALVRACKARDFDDLRDMMHRAPDIASEAQGKVLVRYDALAWHLVLDHGQWELAGLSDDKPQ